MIACLQYGVQQESHDVPLSIIAGPLWGWLIESTGGFTLVVLTLGFGLTLLIRRFPDELAVG